MGPTDKQLSKSVDGTDNIIGSLTPRKRHAVSEIELPPPKFPRQNVSTRLAPPQSMTGVINTGSHSVATQRDRVDRSLRLITSHIRDGHVSRTEPQFISCPTAHGPASHCQFCINLSAGPRTQCLHQSETCHRDNAHVLPTTAGYQLSSADTAPESGKTWQGWTGQPLDFAALELVDDSTETDWAIKANLTNTADRGFTWERPAVSQEFITSFPTDAELYQAVVTTGVPNYRAARIPLSHGLATDVWRAALHDYHDRRVVDYMTYGFPLGYYAAIFPSQNHASATNYREHVDHYMSKELRFDSLLGPFKEPPMAEVHKNPLMSRPKKQSDQRRVIMDLSYAPNNMSVNNGISKDGLEGESIRTILLSAQDLAHHLVQRGSGTYMYGLDLAPAYRQLRIDPADWPLMGLLWQEAWYLDKCPAFGIRLGAHFCCRVTEAFCHMSWEGGQTGAGIH